MSSQNVLDFSTLAARYFARQKSSTRKRMAERWVDGQSVVCLPTTAWRDHTAAIGKKAINGWQIIYEDLSTHSHSAKKKYGSLEEMDAARYAVWESLGGNPSATQRAADQCGIHLASMQRALA